MALVDFCSRSKIVRRGGVVVRCHPPTVETVHLFLAEFPGEIMVAAKMKYDLKIDLGDDPVATLVPLFLMDRSKALRVLGSCCEMRGAALLEDAASADSGLLHEAATAVVSLCDIGRVCDSLQLKTALEMTETEEAAASDEPAGPTPQELAVVALADRFHIDPSVICEWPYERFLSVWECISELNKRDREAAGIEEPFNDWAAREIEKNQE